MSSSKEEQVSNAGLSSLADSIYETISSSLEKHELLPFLLELLVRVKDPIVLPTGDGWQISLKRNDQTGEWLFTVFHPQRVKSDRLIFTKFQITNHSDKNFPSKEPLVITEPSVSWKTDLSGEYGISGLLFFGVPNFELGKICWLSDAIDFETGKRFLTLDKIDGRVLHDGHFVGYLFGYVVLPEPVFGSVGIVTPFRPTGPVRMFDFAFFFNHFMNLVLPIFEKASDTLEALITVGFSITRKKS